MSTKIDFTESSGNVFADLGIPEPEEHKLKSQLVIEIRRLIEQKEWTQTRAAEVIGVPQPAVSQLFRGRFEGFSIDRLFGILNRLGRTIEVSISQEEYDPKEAHMMMRVA